MKADCVVHNVYLFKNSFWDCIHSSPVPLRCLFTFIVNKIYIKFIINFKENPISTRKEIPRSKVIFCYLKWISSVSYQIYEVYTDQNEGLVLSGNHSQKPLYWKFPYQLFFCFYLSWFNKIELCTLQLEEKAAGNFFVFH